MAEDPARVHWHATRLPLTADEYYRERQRRDGDRFQKAGRFIYLNSGAFGGIYRVNRKGEFNVPWGKPKTGHTVDLPNLEAVANTLRKSETCITEGDFQVLLDQAGRDDLVFLDPPYITSHNRNGFVAYNERLFSWSDQERLAEAAESARLRGAHVLVTNADHESIRSLYPNFRHIVTSRSSTLAASAAKRQRVNELLLTGQPAQAPIPNSELSQ